MNFNLGIRRIVPAAAVLAMLASVQMGSAQEIAESHIKAARAAITAIGATKDYDDILPAMAKAMKQNLIQSNPNLVAVITQVVDEETLAIAGRRVDLEKEIAAAYARSFSEADLNAIAAFYTSPAGMKLLTEGPIVTREGQKAVDIWQRGVTRDLNDAVAAKLDKMVAAMAPAPDPNAPVTPDAAPATDKPAGEKPADGSN